MQPLERSNSFNRCSESKQDNSQTYTDGLQRKNSYSKHQQLNKSFERQNDYLKTPLQPIEAPGRKDIPMAHLTLPTKNQTNPCPKHSPMLSTKEYKTFESSTKETHLTQIIPPPIEYSPRTKCKHDLIQFDTFKLPSPPSDEPNRERKKSSKKAASYDMETPFMTSSVDDDEPKLVRKPSRKQHQKEEAKEVRNISLLQVGDLPVPPPPQYSPRSSTRKKEFDHSSICGLPVPPPPQQSPKTKHIHWKQQPTDTIATHSIVRPIKSVDVPPAQTFETKSALQPKGSLSPTRLEKFLSQAVSVQSTLAPIRIPKSSLLGLGVHQSAEQKPSHPQIAKEKSDLSPVRSRRYSVHSSGILETLGVKTTSAERTNVTLSPMRYKQSSDMKILHSDDCKTSASPSKPKSLSRDVSTDSQDLKYQEDDIPTSTSASKERKILSRDASTDSDDLIQFDDPNASPVKSKKTLSRNASTDSQTMLLSDDQKCEEPPKQKLIRPRHNSVEIYETKLDSGINQRLTRDPLLKSFSVDESSRLPPFLTTSLYVETDQHLQYNIAAMVSPSKQLQTTLKPGNGNSYQFLAPRRSWQDIHVHRPSQPNLDILLASEEAALSPIWLPKQPLEPARIPKPKKTLSRKDSLSPSNSFTRSKRSSHDSKPAEDSIVIVTKKESISPSNSINRLKRAEELLQKDGLSQFNSFVKSRKSSQDIMSPVAPRKKISSPSNSLNPSRKSSQDMSSPKSPRKKLSPATSFDKSRQSSQELIIINSEPSAKKNRLSPSNSFRSRRSSEEKANSPKSPRKKKLTPSSSQDLIIISSPTSPTKKTLSPSNSFNTSRKTSLTSPKSPRKKTVSPSQSFDKIRRKSQDVIIISTESSPTKEKFRISSSKSSQDLASNSPKTPKKKKLSPSRSFDLSRQPSRELIIISSPVLTPTRRSPSGSRRSSQQDMSISPSRQQSPSCSRRNSQELTVASPKSPRKKSLSPSNSSNTIRKTSKEDLSKKKGLSPSSSRRSSKSSTPIPSRKNSLSPSNSFNLSGLPPRSSPIPIPSPKRCLSRSNSFSTKSKIFSQTLSIEIPSSPQVLSRSGSINETLSPSNQRQNLLSPALEAALISEISSKLAGVHSSLSPKYTKQSIGINVVSSPRGSYIYSTISPQKSLDIPEISSSNVSPSSSFLHVGMSPQLSFDIPEISSASSLFQANFPEGSSPHGSRISSITSQLSLEVPDMSSTNVSSRRSSSSCIYANISPQKSMGTSTDDVSQSTNRENSNATSTQASNLFGNNMSPQKSPRMSPKLSPIQCPIHVEIHVRIPKDDNDRPIATKSQGTQIP